VKNELIDTGNNLSNEYAKTFLLGTQVFGDCKWNDSLLHPSPRGEVLGEHADRWRPRQ
jgi:hypothetical protein